MNAARKGWMTNMNRDKQILETFKHKFEIIRDFNIHHLCYLVVVTQRIRGYEIPGCQYSTSKFRTLEEHSKIMKDTFFDIFCRLIDFLYECDLKGFHNYLVDSMEDGKQQCKDLTSMIEADKSTKTHAEFMKSLSVRDNRLLELGVYNCCYRLLLETIKEFGEEVVIREGVQDVK